MIDWSSLLGHVPFMVAGTAHPRLNTSKVFESLVIAVLTTGALKFFAIDTLKLEVESLKSQVVILNSRLDSMQHDLYIPRSLSKELK